MNNGTDLFVPLRCKLHKAVEIISPHPKLLSECIGEYELVDNLVDTEVNEDIFKRNGKPKLSHNSYLLIIIPFNTHFPSPVINFPK